MKKIEGITFEGKEIFITEEATRHSSTWKDGEFSYTSYTPVIITEDGRKIA
jgi:hypothetical protein